MKKKYYLIGFFILAIAILAYHLYAASEAEQQIDKAIREQAANSDSISVQYSSIDVGPFSGKISFSELTIIFQNHIQNVKKLTFNTSYLDFLNIYFGGLSYGLGHLDEADIILQQPSYVNQKSRREFKMDTLRISYRGNALDGLLATINDSDFSSPHSVKAQSSSLIVRFRGTLLSEVAAKNFHYSGTVSERKNSFWKDGNHQFSTDSLIWSPSESFQNTYQFFIRGFGYPTDAIPFESARFYSEPVPQEDTLQIKAMLESELAQVSADGFIDLNEPLATSQWQNMDIAVRDLSESFKQLLQNLEQLLSISLPGLSDGITLEVTGTLKNSHVTTNANNPK